MPFQTQKNVVVAYKEQASGLGSPESGAGGTGISVNPSQGMGLNAADIESQAVRSDGMTRLGRLGSYDGQAQYEGELSLATFDDWLEAVMRGTWTAAIALDETTNGGSGALGDLTVGTDTLTAAAGSWIENGVRAGQMIQLSNTTETANHNEWFRVLSVTASVITCPTASFTASGPETTWDITVAKHLISADPPTERYFTVEEHYQDIDASKVLEDAKVGSLTLSITPDNHVLTRWGLAGTDIRSESAGNAPVLTTPTYTSTVPLVLLDGSLRVSGSDRVDVTNFELTFNANPQTQAVAGQRKSPDVFMDNAVGQGSLTLDVDDLDEFAAFKNETNIELFLHIAENEAGPADFISIYAGFSAYRGSQTPFGQSGPLTETLPFRFGVDERGTGYAESMLVISTSSA